MSHFRVFNTDIYFINETKKGISHHATLHRLLNFMKDRGFEIGRDPDIEQNYKILNKDHWYGRKKDLEFKASRYPAGFEINFYQNIVFENKSGGYYDFHKYEKMPYLIKLLFRNEVRHIKEFLEKLGYQDNSEPVYELAKDKIKYHFVGSWHHPQKSMDDFELENLNGQTPEYSCNNTDRDKKTIFNGETKYFRDRWTGRLVRGKVYHNINNMWWVLLNAFEYTNVADFQLFDLTKEDLIKRRVKQDRKPEKYIVKRQQIELSKTKELVRELKRRGVKVAV